MTKNATKHGSWKVKTFRLLKIWKSDESDVDKIYNKITLPSAFTGKQANHHIPLSPPPPPPTRSWKVKTFRLLKIWKSDESDVDKIYNKITLPSAFTGKQANHHIPLSRPPPPPPQLNVVFWVTNSFLASITSHVNIA